MVSVSGCEDVSVLVIHLAIVEYMVTKSGGWVVGCHITTGAFRLMWDLHAFVIQQVVAMHGVYLGEVAKGLWLVFELHKHSP